MKLKKRGSCVSKGPTIRAGARGVRGFYARGYATAAGTMRERRRPAAAGAAMRAQRDEDEAGGQGAGDEEEEAG